MKIIPLSAVAIFCEDVRDEIAGTVSLVGVFSDAIQVPEFPGLLPRLTLYARIAFDPGAPPIGLSVSLRVDAGPDLVTTEFDREMVEKSVRDTTLAETPVATLLARISGAPFIMNDATMIKAVLRANGEEYVIGSLKVSAAE